MADPWELILHHTYTGTPGVVCDQSPGRGSHGVAVNLADSDFLVNGISAGSGAVTFHPGSSVRVSGSKIGIRWAGSEGSSSATSTAL